MTIEKTPQLKPKLKVEEEKKEITDQEVFAALERLKINAEDSEANKTLQDWARQEHNKVPNNLEAMIRFNLKMARMYLETGHGEASYDMFCDALEQATNEGDEELARQIQAEIDGILNRPGSDQE